MIFDLLAILILHYRILNQDNSCNYAYFMFHPRLSKTKLNITYRLYPTIIIFASSIPRV